MKKVFTLLLAALFFLSFTHKTELESCLLSFKGITEIKGEVPRQIDLHWGTSVQLPAANGNVELSVRDVYTQLFYYKKQPFVNVNVEFSLDSLHYGQDTLRLLDNVKFTNSIWSVAESSELTEMEFNGYKVYG